MYLWFWSLGVITYLDLLPMNTRKVGKVDENTLVNHQTTGKAQDCDLGVRETRLEAFPLLAFEPGIFFQAAM